MALREAPQHEGAQVEVTSENSRKAEEQREPHTRGDTHAQETGTALQEFKAVCARRESASETGFAIRGSEKKKKWPQTRGCQHSTQKPKSEKGEEEEGRSSCVSPSSLFLDPAGNSGCGQSPRPDHPGSHSRLLSAAPAPQPAFPRGGRAELGLRPGRRKEAAAAGRRKLSLTHLGSLRALEVWRESGGITV